jgi:hypothetical protein
MTKILIYPGDNIELIFSDTKAAKERGQEFLNRVREIIAECAKLPDPGRAAHVTAFSILVMLDSVSGESGGTQYKVQTDDGEDVEFFHHDL